MSDWRVEVNLPSNTVPRRPARSISQPVAEALARTPFQGQIHSVFDRACNLVNDQQDIITLALLEIENGPFSILIEGLPSCFNLLEPGQPVLGDPNCLNVGPWRVDLTQAEIWNPQLPFGNCAFELPAALAEVIKPYSLWPLGHASGMDNRMAMAIHETTRRL